MRYLIFLLFIFPFSSLCVAEGVTPETVMRAAHVGAPRFALAAAEEAQAASRDRSQWFSWEVVRWDLLYQLKRWQELLHLTQALPHDVPEAIRHYALWRNAQAAAALHQDVEARELFARLIWQGALDTVQMREARRLVIETLLSQGRGDDAYLAILRYQQDFHPLERSEIEHFAYGLSGHGKASEALAWLPQVGDRALALLLRLRGGEIQANEVVEQARAELSKSKEGGFWAVLGQAAKILQDYELQVTALENQLSAQQENQPVFHARTEDLWQAYNALALSLGNQHQLLLGDEGAWLDLAAKMEQENPLAERALLAYLARQSNNPVIRKNTQTRWFGRMIRAGLVRTAFHMYSDQAGLTLMLLDDPAWLEDAEIRRSVLRELASYERQSGGNERAAAYMLEMLDDQP